MHPSAKWEERKVKRLQNALRLQKRIAAAKTQLLNAAAKMHAKTQLQNTVAKRSCKTQLQNAAAKTQLKNAAAKTQLQKRSCKNAFVIGCVNEF
jgi:hypothetical protein